MRELASFLFTLAQKLSKMEHTVARDPRQFRSQIRLTRHGLEFLIVNLLICLINLDFVAMNILKDFNHSKLEQTFVTLFHIPKASLC